MREKTDEILSFVLGVIGGIGLAALTLYAIIGFVNIAKDMIEASHGK